MRDYFVYIMTNKSGTLYIGITNNLERRVHEHKTAMLQGFTRRYRMDNLLYVETYPDPSSAIEREKQIKGWLRRRKIELIREQNPRWQDLAADWHTEGPDPSLRSG